MCPACMVTALLAVTGATSLGGASALLAKKARHKLRARAERRAAVLSARAPS